MKRKLIAGLTTLMMMCNFVPHLEESGTINIIAFAESEGDDSFTIGTFGYLKYRKYIDHIEIGACDEETFAAIVDEDQLTEEEKLKAQTVVIPAEIDGLPVTSIGDSAFKAGSLKSIVIPDTVECIGNSAFMQSSLQFIEIPSSVKTINSLAFNNCHYLKEITIPDSVIKLGSSALASCSNLTTVKLSNNLSEIEYGTFFYSNSLNTITIPESVTKIGMIAFQHCDQLTDITIPANVTIIEEGAFGWCEKLNSITILNPECNISKSYISAQTNGFWGTIYGYENSTAQKYAEEKNCQFQLIQDSTTLKLGDLNNDGSINANDAANVLIAAASIGTGNESGLTTEQETAADVNGDSEINAVDAAIILQYAAAVGSGENVTIKEFV